MLTNIPLILCLIIQFTTYVPRTIRRNTFSYLDINVYTHQITFLYKTDHILSFFAALKGGFHTFLGVIKKYVIFNNITWKLSVIYTYIYICVYLKSPSVDLCSIILQSNEIHIIRNLYPKYLNIFGEKICQFLSAK